MAPVMLKDVNMTSQNWTIQARAVRFCDFISTYQPNKRIRIDFVLLDEEGNTMEAQVPEYWHKRSKVELQEDHVYIIKYFEVSNRKKLFRVVDRDCIVCFTPHTLIEEVKSVLENFPVYVHSAASFDTLRARIDNDTVTSDVIAALTACSHVRDQNTPRSGTKRLRNLTISDGMESVGIALWGKQADEFDAEAYMNDNIEKPVVILFCGMTCRKYNDVDQSDAIKSTGTQETGELNTGLGQTAGGGETTPSESTQKQDEGPVTAEIEESAPPALGATTEIEESTPPPSGAKRPYVGKGKTEPAKQKKTESSARRKLKLSDSSDSN